MYIEESDTMFYISGVMKLDRLVGSAKKDNDETLCGA